MPEFKSTKRLIPLNRTPLGWPIWVNVSVRVRSTAGTVSWLVDTVAGSPLSCEYPVRQNRTNAENSRCRISGFAGRLEYKNRFLINRSEEHTSELQSLMRISYAVFCLKKKKT